MSETERLRDFSAFKGWNFRAGIDKNTHIVWTETRCKVCQQLLFRHWYTITSTQQELLIAKLVPKTSNPIEKSHIPFAGGPCLCDQHYKEWLEARMTSEIT
jgi:hypothetical protein